MLVGGASIDTTQVWLLMPVLVRVETRDRLNDLTFNYMETIVL